MEHVHGGELNSYLRKNKVSEANMVNIMRQLIEGLRYLHMCGIVHRDLKPENILIEVRTKDDFVIKITDFGLSKLANRADLLFECCGTPAYVAPEVLIKKGYQSEVDLWSCGVILYAMVCTKFPFHSNDRKETFNQIKHKDPEFHHKQFTEDVSPICIDFIRKLLTKDPKKRITIDQALEHEFFHNKLAKVEALNVDEADAAGSGETKQVQLLSAPMLDLIN